MKTWIIVIIDVAIVILGYFLFRGGYKSSSTNSSTPVATNSVDIKGFAFNPASITVNSGDTITFTNNDGTNHTITANDGSFDKSIFAGATVTLQITKPGTYSYHCKIHTSMTGTIIVK